MAENNNFFIKSYQKNKEKISGTQNTNEQPKTVKPAVFERIVVEEIKRDKITAPVAKKAEPQQTQPAEQFTKAYLSALYLILIGEVPAVKIIGKFNPAELEKIVKEMIKIAAVTPDEKAAVFKSFGQFEPADLSQFPGGKEYARLILIKAFGISDGSGTFLKIVENEEKSDINYIESLDDSHIKSILEEESEVVISTVMSLLSPAKAAKFIQSLPREQGAAILKRLSASRGLPTEVVKTILAKLKAKGEELKSESGIKVAGKSKLIEILKMSGSEDADKIIDELARMDVELADEIRESIFSFGDIVNIPKKEFEKALKTFENKDIAFILKGAAAEIKTIFFTCVSQRRSELIENEMEILGKVKKSDVDEKRRDFIKDLLRMESEGQIILKPDVEQWVE